MFCMKCGNKIDDDSTFCPYCGSKTKVNSNITVQQPSIALNNLHNKQLSKKLIIWGAGCLAAVLVVVGVVKLFSGGIGDTVAEQLFLMSWKELVELDKKEFKSQMRDEGVTYGQIDDDYSSALYTKSFSSFMDYDCKFACFDESYIEAYYTSMSIKKSFDLPVTMFLTLFNAQDDYKDGKNAILKYLNKNQSKLCDVIETDAEDAESYIYLLDVDAENVDSYIDCYEETAEAFLKAHGDDAELGINVEESLKNLTDKIEELRENKSDYKIYKFCAVGFGNLADLRESEEVYELEDIAEDFFPDMDDYYDYGCMMTTWYVWMTDDGFRQYMAKYDYDIISKKKIDLEEVRKTIDVDLLDEKIGDSKSDLRAIYFVENHGVDIKSDMDVSTDELKKLWYIKKYGWDIDAAEFIDLSDYRNSTGIYCAINYNYNIDEDTYFESDLDKAVYLTEKGYNLDDGSTFESEEDKRMWLLRNYSYDTITSKTIDKEMVEVLLTYADYSQEVLSDDGIFGYNLIYIDDNDIPECLVWTASEDEYGDEDGRVFVLSYQNGEIESVTQIEDIQPTVIAFSYTPKTGRFYMEMSYYRTTNINFFTLTDGKYDLPLYTFYESSSAYTENHSCDMAC